MKHGVAAYLGLFIGLVILSISVGHTNAQLNSGIDPSKLEMITAENAASLEELFVFEQENSQYAGDLAFNSFSPNINLFAFSINGSLNVWDITTGEYVWRVPCCVRQMIFSPDSQYLITSEAGLLYRWNVSSPNDWLILKTGRRSDHTDYVNPLDIRYLESADEIIATYNATGGIVRWDNEGQLLDKLDYGYGPDIPTVQNALFDELGNLNILLLSGQLGNTVEIREVSSDRVRAVVDFSKIAADEGFDDYFVDLLDVSQVDDLLVNIASSNYEKGLLAWINFDGEILNYEQHDLGQLSIADYPGPPAVDGIMALGSARTGEVYLWNTDTVYQYAMINGHDEGIVDLAFNPGRTLLASSSRDGTVKLWGVPSDE
jgi:WD40 repeat protein